ncbi:uncharacterized protein BDV17DRAFT_255613 [Aspergillus undulatus]|uniref:uncharacterized protein n=1 Tax=Aspergillus undulatus TaxID=1810928 RepID=UPI003CCD4BBA
MLGVIVLAELVGLVSLWRVWSKFSLVGLAHTSLLSAGCCAVFPFSSIFLFLETRNHPERTG